MVDRTQIENALKIAMDDLILDDENVNKDEIDDVINEFNRLAKLLKKEATEPGESDEDSDEDEDMETDEEEDETGEEP